MSAFGSLSGMLWRSACAAAPHGADNRHRRHQKQQRQPQVDGTPHRMARTAIPGPGTLAGGVPGSSSALPRRQRVSRAAQPLPFSHKKMNSWCALMPPAGSHRGIASSSFVSTAKNGREYRARNGKEWHRVARCRILRAPNCCARACAKRLWHGKTRQAARILRQPRQS